LHGGILHIFFNGQALLGFGGLIEYLSNRAHLLIVFVLAIIGGGLCSLFFMPDGNSVGASGGIMGLIGYLAIYGFRRKRQLPPISEEYADKRRIYRRFRFNRLSDY
jgi:membrane associated rhomboid family serine protease